MGSYGGGVRQDLGVGLEAKVGVGIGVGRGMSARLDAVALEAMEALAEGETPGNGERKVILCFTQSINGLQRESQLYPRTMLQDESRRVTYKSMEMMSLEGKRTGREMDWEM